MSHKFFRGFRNLFLLAASFAVVVMSGCSTTPPPTPTLIPPTPSPTPAGKTIVVTSHADTGPGALRQAMEEAQNGDTITFDPAVFPTMRNLNTVMAGNKPLEIPVEIESDVTNLMSFGFSLPNGDRLLAVWNDGVAVDYDPGVLSTLTFPGTSVTKVSGIDVLNGFEQELIIEIENGNLVIRNFLIKDYPIILRLVD